MKKIFFSEPQDFLGVGVGRVPETKDEAMAALRKPDRSTYEKHLQVSLVHWGEAAEERYQTLVKNLEEGTSRYACHILMENWFSACEQVAAYEKALGIKEGRSFECGSNSPSSEGQS